MISRAEDLNAIYLRSQNGELVRLDAVVRVKRTPGPTLIARQNLQYAANLKGSPTWRWPKRVAEVQTAARDILPWLSGRDAG